MNTKKILIAAFSFMVLSQWCVPFFMIRDTEQVLKNGTAYKFRTVPIDPNDPFRGKYMTLNFLDNSVKVEDIREWHNGQTAYALVGKKDDYAYVKSIQKYAPLHSEYFKVEIDYTVPDTNSQRVILRFPFNKYFMNESKAPIAEDLYRKRLMDTSTFAYAVVYIRDGISVLSDVKIGDSSLIEMVTK